MRLKVLIILIILSSALLKLKAQELNCNVQVVTQQIQGTNKQLFRTLQTAIYEFINDRNWSNDVYAATERIECNILINLTEQLGSDQFKGTIQVQMRRPVYNTSYNTTILNLLDNNLDFRYVEYQPLLFDETQHIDNLTSVLAYYANIILGFDYDSFSPEGGSRFFTQAEAIVMNAQNAPERGWKAFDASGNRNRYWLIQNIMDSEYQPVRQFYYQYHRQGLDHFEDNVNVARNDMEGSLKHLQRVYRQKPDPYLYLLQVIYDAKTDEFINVFQEASPDQKRRVYVILKEIDPSNQSKYEAAFLSG